MRIDLLGIGQDKNSTFSLLGDMYLKRMTRWPVTGSFYDIKGVQSDKARLSLENEKLKAALHAPFKGTQKIIALDSRGKNLTSEEFATLLQGYEEDGTARVFFVMGGAGGLTSQITGDANAILSMGRQTWPHLLARVMILEQIYRAQQILGGHPYHKE